MTERAPHLVLEKVSATYGDTVAVTDLDLTVGRGELVALLGPSGCGKTTTLRMVAGFVAPSAGRIRLDGKDLVRLPAHRRNIGVVFQSYALFPHLTVLENVGFGLRMRHVAREERAGRARAALAMVGLDKLADRYPGQLSGGQQQRVALARALVIEPAVLLLDEPLSNLDAGLRADMRAEIRALQQRLSITTLFVTHDQQEALAMSDRVAVMDHGRLVEVGTPLALCDRPAHAHTAAFLGARTVIEGTSADGTFRAPGLACAGAPDGATRLVLRAARLRFSTSGEGGLDLAGTVTATAFLDDVYEAEVATPAGPVRVVVPSDLPPPPPGSACRLAALPGAAHFIA
ncbi:ABC transporter ATP-binding protein [Prosthecomicrobium sp. N25]|uniref:ABC transporter ATP-binding protein n=1 Tax=Prosthecomicrobium sp. N25 TaxID=3129254 RepID=UPI003077694D